MRLLVKSDLCYHPRMLKWCLLLPALTAYAVPPQAIQPRVTLCIERLLHMAHLRRVDDSDAQLTRLRAGVELLRTLDTAGSSGGTQAWEAIEPYFEETVLSIEADAVLEKILRSLPAGDPTRPEWLTLQQKARRRIFIMLRVFEQRYGPPLCEDSYCEPIQAELLGRVALKLMSRSDSLIADAAAMQLALRLSNATTPEAMAAALSQLFYLVCMSDEGDRPAVYNAAIKAMAHVFIRLMRIQLDENNPYDVGDLLGFYASGDAGTFLDDIDYARENRSLMPTFWNMRARHRNPRANWAQLIAESRQDEIEQLLLGSHLTGGGIPVRLFTSFLEQNPAKLPDGSTVSRQLGRQEELILMLTHGLFYDVRSGGEDENAVHAMDAITYLTGDPRVDSASLYDWVHSLYGERRSVSPEHFVRFVQEVHPVSAIVRRLDLKRKVYISREHRKTPDEELGPSFDLLVADTNTKKILEVVEVKQTSRPRQASDIGGILRQATKKLDGLFTPVGLNLKPMWISSTKPKTLRNLKAKRVLVVQMPWEEAPFRYIQGSLQFISHANGTVERWTTGADPRLIRTDNLFADIAKHFSTVTDTDYFDEIQFTTLRGRPIVTYTQNRQAKSWGVVPFF